MPLLSWSGRDTDLARAARAPYRLLEPVANLAYGEPDSPNMLIEGDNLDALKALLPYYAGQVKCIFIDPPYNTRSAFEHYDDNLEHSQWLSMMYPRLELLRELLSEDGVVWMILDNNEVHYAKVLLDELFGRNNFLNMISLTTNDPSGFKATSATIFSTANHLLVYAKDRTSKPLRKVMIPKAYDAGYNKVLVNPEADPSEWSWVGIGEHVASRQGYPSTRAARSALGEMFDDAVAAYAIANADQVFQLVAIGGGAAKKRAETIGKSRLAPGKVHVHPGEDIDGFYIANGRQLVFYEDRLAEIDGEVVPVEIMTDIWTDISWNGIGPEGGVDFKNGKKPEALVARVLELTTREQDLVLDSFLGSGTTAAVAHKMRRRWIGIEIGEQARVHCQPRLARVVDGDQGGISAAAGWKGGGGFRYFKLGVRMRDEDGHMSEGIRFQDLAAHVWFSETGAPLSLGTGKSAYLGAHNGTGYYLLFNGILGDLSKGGGNVLTRRVLRSLPPFEGFKVIYGEACDLTDDQLADLGIRFRQTPYDIKGR